jgi:hypothetical protein
MAEQSTKHWYESHVTVELPDPGIDDLHSQTADDVLRRFQEFCKLLDAKCLWIRLRPAQQNAIYPEHLMLAKSQQFENDEAANLWILDLHRAAREDFIVRRTKLEAELTPGPAAYFEAHWKLGVVASEARAVSEFTRCYPHLYYSYNMINGNHYMSARFFELDALAAGNYFGEASKLINRRFPIIKGHYERVINDSYPTLDRGWAHA